MRWLHIILSISIAVVVAGPASASQMNDDKPVLRLTLPPDKSISWNKPVKCSAIASAGMFQELRPGDEKRPDALLSVYAKKGTDTLKLWREGGDLIVQAGAGEEKPDRYRIVNHNRTMFVALFSGGELLPVAKTITINIDTGFAVWSLTEPLPFPVSPYPFAESIYLHCQN